VAFSESFLAELRDRVPVSTVVGQRHKLRKEGAEFRAIDDHSLTISPAKSLWWDHSVGKGGDIFDWFQEREGLSFPEAVERCASIAGVAMPQTNGASKPARQEPRKASTVDNDVQAKREVVATWDYTAPDGTLLYQVLRMQFRLPDGSWEIGDNGKPKKTFRQRRPARGDDDKTKIDRDGFVWNLEGVDHGLYPLVEFRELKSADDLTFIPEGEGKVDTLRGMGFVAVTNSGGAKNWSASFAELFRGLDVVIPIDNDDPGRQRGETIAASLRGIARRTRILDFAAVWPSAPKGADVTDWKRDREGSAEELREIADKLPEWREPPFVSRFRGIPFERLDEPGPEHEYLIDDWMTVGDKSVIGGASRSGKSFLAVEATGCIATATPFFGSKVLTPGLVIYQAGEGANGIKKRFRAWRQYNRITPGTRIPIFILQSKIDIYRPDGDTPALIGEIEGIARHYDVPLRALFIDTLAKAQGAADENSGKDMSIVMGNIDRISEAFPRCHVCLVHHFNAAGTRLRGHSSVYANLDQAILVTKDERTKICTAMLDKQKDGEDGKEIRFELFVVEVGRRAFDDKPITSCVTIPAGDRHLARSSGRGVQTIRLSDQRTVILQSLKDAMADHGEPTPDHLRLPRSIVTVVNAKKWKEVYLGRSGDDAADNTINKRLRDASDQFLRLRIIGRINPYVWLVPGRSIAGVQFGDGETRGEPAAEAPNQELLGGDDLVF